MNLEENNHKKIISKYIKINKDIILEANNIQKRFKNYKTYENEKPCFFFF